MQQIEISYEPGVLEQHDTFGDAVRASVYSCGRQLKAIAADLDMTSSELSRKLADNANDPVHFPLHRLPELMDATGSLTPLYWLVARYLEGSAARRERVLAELEPLLPKLRAALAELSR